MATLSPEFRAHIIKPGEIRNPAGKPPGTRGLIRYLREKTKNGRELIDRLLDIARGKLDEEGRQPWQSADQIRALIYLTDKVLPFVDDAGPILDGERLTDAERAELAAIQSRVRAIAERIERDQPS